MTKPEAAKQMVSRRAETGLSQREIGLATGIAQAQVSAFERGEGSTSPTAVAYLDLILKTPVEELRGLAQTAAMKIRAEKVEADARKKVSEALPAIARELRAFRTRNRMTLADVADTVGYSDSQVYRIIRGEVVPPDDKIAAIRVSMARYEGKPVKVDRPVTDKPGAAMPTPRPSPFAPKPVAVKDEPKPDMMQHLGTAAVPPFESVNTEGVFLVNGTNLAPHLTLDGKTMHVFTVVPGGVFLSKLTMKGNR